MKQRNTRLTAEELKQWEERMAKVAENLSDESLDFDRMLTELEREGATPPQSTATPAGATM